MRNSLIKIITSFFYVGFLPFIPGTFGSLAGLILFFGVKNYIPVYILIILALSALGLLYCGKAEQIFNKKDPRFVVIDEVVGMLLSLVFLPFDLRLVVLGFFLFRLLDTLKPYPACVFERMHGGIGIMGDDIVAGIYTNIVLQVFWRLISAIA